VKKFAIAAMMIVLLPASAYAQRKGPVTARTDLELKNDAAIDKDYQDTLKRTSNKKPVKQDPWQSVRPSASDTATANTTTNTKR